MYGGSTCLVFLGAWLVELRNLLQRLAHEGWRRAKSPNTRSRTFGIAISNAFGTILNVRHVGSAVK